MGKVFLIVSIFFSLCALGVPNQESAETLLDGTAASLERLSATKGEEVLHHSWHVVWICHATYRGWGMYYGYASNNMYAAANNAVLACRLANPFDPIGCWFIPNSCHL